MKTNVVLLTASFFLFQLSCANLQCRVRNLTITVDNFLELYIDGEKKENLPNAAATMRADTVYLPCSTQVIAVKGTDNGTVGGILASTEDGYVLTNSSWRCTSVYSAGWERVGFNDSLWPSAEQIVANGERPWRYIEGIRRDAVWIWTQYYAGINLVVYCRRQLIPVPIPPPPRPSRTLVITVDNQLRLWIDGTEKTNLPNADNWRRADTADLPWSSRVIAVQGTDDEFVAAGILASTQDGFIVTNASWKCTNVYSSGWNQIGFDDSLWPVAEVIAIHVTSPWQYVGAIRLDAYWIWTRTNTRRDRVVYCRKNLVPYYPTTPRPLCPSRKLAITVDNYMRLWIDGIEKTNLPNANNWRRADTIDLPWNTRLIAVQGTDDGIVAAGILGSTADGYILTNASWKCTNVYFSRWNQIGFDDSSWPAAYVIAVHQTYPWTHVPGIRTDAYWIWTRTYNTRDRVVYCRKNLAIPIVCGRG